MTGLQDHHVLIAQPRQARPHLINALQAEAAVVTHLPTMHMTTIDCTLPWEHDGSPTYTIISSQHAVASFAKAYKPHMIVMAVGPTTAEALQDAGIHVQHIAPPPYGTEALMRLPLWALPTPHHLGIFCGKDCGQKLQAALSAKGMSPQLIHCYERTPCPPPPKRFWSNPFDAIICLSHDNLKILDAMLTNSTQSIRLNTPLFVIHTPMALAAKAAGWATIITMQDPTPSSIIKCLTDYFKEKSSL